MKGLFFRGRMIVLAGTLSAMLFLIFAYGCGGSSSTTQQSSQSGVSGTVKYTGAKKGGILIYAADQIPRPNEAPQPKAMSQFNDVSGGIDWNLPAGIYYINAFLAVDREPSGPPLAGDPAVNCNAITVTSGSIVNVDIVLTDADTGGSKDCVRK